LSSPFKPQIIFGTVGILLIIVGIISGKLINTTNSKVEVLDSPSAITNDVSKDLNNIVIDISGAVQNPGVYHLSGGSRVEDAIIAASGLSANADRALVDKSINRAAKLIDGQKIYIPAIKQSNVLGASNSTTQSNVAQSNTTSDSSLVNINQGSLQELESLPGIGPVYAQNITDHRPYSDLSELTSKKIIPQSTFNKIKDMIALY
jgi:competence protein ComEA